MVIKFLANKKARTVEITVDVAELTDLWDGINRLLVQKEEELAKEENPKDREKYLGYKKLLTDLTNAKALLDK